MCRLFGFRSAVESSVHSSLVAAENALALQSRKHRDGWGIGHYLGPYPHVIRNDEQALNDVLFRELSGVVATCTFIAHIRLATAGPPRVLNCHPFQHGRWTFAHNGEIVGWDDAAVQKRVRACIDERFQRHVLGDTDSEVLFYLFLSQLARRIERIQDDGVRTAHAVPALGQAVAEIKTAVPLSDPEKRHRLNVLLTNGNLMLAYREHGDLCFSTYKDSCPERDNCYAYDKACCEAAVGPDRRVKHLIVSSEPVNDGPNQWESLGEGEYVGVDDGMLFERGRLIG